MNTETQKTTFYADGHPDENQLLLALERELSPEETSKVEQHLGNCWSCRARSSEMQSGILAFVEYREKRYLPSLEPPPQDFGGFRGKLGRIAAEGKPESIALRIWRRIQRFMTPSKQMKWVTATAAIMAVVIFWTQVFLNPSVVSASEFLARATAAQNPVTQEKDRVIRTAHQKVRITSGQQTVVREFEWTVGSPILQTGWQTKADPSIWNTPFTADGFAAWRNSVSTRKDRVKRSGDHWTLDTTADDDVVKEAWLVVRASDFHPLEQHIRFADDRQLDFEELAFRISAAERPHSESAAPAQVMPKSPARTPEVVSEPAVNLDEAELELRYAMFTNQWDLGEDLLIARTPSGVAVTGTASSGDRAASMKTILSGLPNVQISITAPGVIGRLAAANRSVPGSPAASTTPLLKETLNQAFPSTEQRRDFVDRCLATSDTGLSHAWALKKLVDRYSEAHARLLKPESQDKLSKMLRTHLQQLADANAGLDPLIGLLPGSRSQEPDVPGDWRAGILALFARVQQQDSLVASLVVGTQANGQDAAAASGSLRSVHQAIGVLLKGLNNLDLGNHSK